jgi:hypothetical protein
MSSFHSGTSDIKRRKIYDLEEILDDKLLAVFEMNYDALTTFFDEIDIISWEKIESYFEENFMELNEIKDLFWGYQEERDIDIPDEITGTLKKRSSDYLYYRKYISILRKKGLEILKLLKYLRIGVLNDEDMNEIILKLDIDPDLGINGKTFMVILRTLFVIYNELKILVENVNSFEKFKKQFLNGQGDEEIEKSYPSSDLLITGKYDKTSIRVRRY